MRIETAFPQRASEALLAHIRANYDSIPAFCESHPELDRLKVQKAIGKGLKRADAAFAFAVQTATGGAVLAEWWAEPASTDLGASSERAAGHG